MLMTYDDYLFCVFSGQVRSDVMGNSIYDKWWNWYKGSEGKWMVEGQLIVWIFCMGCNGIIPEIDWIQLMSQNTLT